MLNLNEIKWTKDLVFVRMLDSQDIEAGATHTRGAVLASGLVLPADIDSRAGRGVVVGTGPQCRRLVAGDTVLCPDLSIQEPAFQIENYEGTFQVFHEPDLLVKIDVIS